MTGTGADAGSGRAAGPPEGVRELDHTADVAIEVSAADRAQLLRRAAEGTWYLVFGEREEVSEARSDDSEEEGRELRIDADGPDALLLKWLQELLYWHEVDGFVARRVRFETLSGRRLVGRVWGGGPRHEPVRDLKGVTYHGLYARPENGGWTARVIFDI